MAYGVDSLLVRIRMAFGATITADPASWVWTDVTAYWHVDDPVEIEWGRSNRADQAETATMSLTLKDTDSRFTAMDPRSPYWPHVRKWTPIEYDIDLGDGAGWRNRFSGSVRKWPLTWPGRSPLMALARIEAVGLLGRLGRGKPAPRSALRRYLPQTSPIAYWALEDGTDSTLAASGLLGGTPMTVVSGIMDFVTEAPPGSAGSAQPSIDAVNGLSAPIVGGSATDWQVSVWTRGVQSGAEADPHYYVPVEIQTTSGWVLRQIMQVPRAAIGWYEDADAIVQTGFTGIVAPVIDGEWHLLQTTFHKSGADTVVQMWLDGVAGPVAVATGLDFGAPIHVLSTSQFSGGDPINAGVSEMQVAHLALHNGSTLVDQYQVGLGDPGETATTRLARLCAEDGVDVSIPAVDAVFDTGMGPQQVAVPLELYRLCEDADQGLLYESGFGLAYLPRGNRYNPPVALTIDGSAGQLSMPFDPVDDDQTLRNRWTVERIDGSSAVALDQASIDSQGEIEGSARVNVSTDDVLPDHAGWRLHLATVEEPRYPSVSIDLGAHPELAADWCAVKPGSRINVINPPAQNVPGTVDQLVVGGRETYRGRRSWKATMNVVPARPWDVGVYGTSRYDTAGSEVLTAAASTATSLDVVTTSGPVWTTDPAMMPLDLRVGGERVTVSAAGLLLFDSFTTRVIANGWGSTSTGAWPWTTEGGFPSNYLTTGSRGRHSATARATSYITAVGPDVVDADYTVGMVVGVLATGGYISPGLAARFTSSSGDYYLLRAEFKTDQSISLTLFRRTTASGFVTLGSFAVTSTTHSTGSGYSMRLQAIGDRIRAKFWRTSAGEPAAWDIDVTDPAPVLSAGKGACRSFLESANTNVLPVAVEYDNFTLVNVQRLTVARSVNGVVKPHTAGTPVRLWTPAVYAL